MLPGASAPPAPSSRSMRAAGKAPARLAAASSSAESSSMSTSRSSWSQLPSSSRHLRGARRRARSPRAGHDRSAPHGCTPSLAAPAQARGKSGNALRGPGRPGQGTLVYAPHALLGPPGFLLRAGVLAAQQLGCRPRARCGPRLVCNGLHHLLVELERSLCLVARKGGRRLLGPRAPAQPVAKGSSRCLQAERSQHEGVGWPSPEVLCVVRKHHATACNRRRRRQRAAAG